ncbi:probable disease resistance protein At5g66900 isoform X1 [Cornus florida]|uniref:probable disease resistance protein At5g66900 isoform X1 n=1 Tax=Cornus florida TaxID=4283 RepID=UPI00289C584D|nr:probable disease resistance protein At5g66900 isoform X1 [Cornus florida]XP_059623785.1 probable disease resistance protein At5g66900 isoform X1 [Cornus florida]
MADVALGVVFDRLLKAVLDFKDKTIYFKSILKKLESRLRSIEPTVREIVSLDRVLNNPEAEMKMLTDWLIEAEELVHKCSKIQWWNCFAKVSHSTKLQKLDDKLRDFFETGMQVVQARDSKKMLVTVNKIDEKLDRMYSFVGSCGAPGVPEFIVGLEEPLQELKTRLLRDDGQVIVLSAPGGCGKTTLAKMLCHDVQIKEKFMDNIFFVTVSKTPILRVIVQNMFRHKSDTVPEFQNDDDALNQLEILLKQIQTIQSSPILLVLDDVWTESESLIHNFKFQIPGYKILVTSRSEFPGFNSTYKLELLSDQDAMALFRHSAFPQGGSMSVPEDLVHKIVRGCRRFPLALIVVGKSLCGEPEVIWRDTLEQWSEGQSVLDSNNVLLTRLKTSIDALDNRYSIKECFMDLGSFPEDQRIPAMTLMDIWVELYNLDEGGIHAVANIHKLASRNLVNRVFTREDANEIDGLNEHFVMQHDLLRELAIHLSSREPIEQRQRLIMDIRGYDFPEWFVEPIQPFHARLLSISTDETFSSRWGSMLPPEVEVLILNFRTRNYSLPKFMEKMDQLKVLIITNYGFCPAELSNFQLLGFLSSLKRIRLEHVSISFLSETTLQLTNLRKISLIMCQIGETFKNCTFEFAHMFPNLVEINIHCCSDLVELPDRLCDIICLKKLSITKCHGLDALPERLGRLTNLEVLRLHSCTGLKGLPESVVSLHKLRILDISDCLNISELPIRIGELRGLETLNMRGCEMHQLPPSVKDLGDLKDVICDEETVNLWEPFKIHLNNARITVLKEDKNLNWLSGLYH